MLPRARWRIGTFLLCGLVACPLVAQTTQRPQATLSGTINLMAAVVLDAVDIKPIPLLEYDFVSASGRDTVRLTTALDGRAHASVAAGNYRVSTPKPPVIRGVRYSWTSSVAVIAGQAVSLEFTNTNATIDTVQAGASRAATVNAGSSEGETYAKVKRGVVRIQAGLGQGTGFFADTLGGVILTNDHVAGVAGPIIVVVDSLHRFEAQRLAHDHEADVAVLRVAAGACADCPRLRIAGTSSQPQEGDHVMAIGFPLNQERVVTTGIVSGIREGAVISDVNINHGNSGGPLLNAMGQVVAINTFGDFTSDGGPGISGSVLMARATSALKAALDSLATAPAPNAEPLPALPAGSFSVSELEKLGNVVETDDYRDLSGLDIGSFRAVFTTPVTFAVAKHKEDSEVGKDRKKREAKGNVAADERYSFQTQDRDWHEFVGEPRKAAVALVVTPGIGETGGSFLKRALLSPALKAKYTYTGDVRGVTVWRDSEVVVPVSGGHGPIPTFVDNQWVSMKDVADRGYYVFDPRVFRPEADGRVPRIQIVVDDLKHPKSRACLTLSRREVARIWNDFEMFFAEHPDSVPFVKAIPESTQVLKHDLPSSVTGCNSAPTSAGNPMGGRP